MACAWPRNMAVDSSTGYDYATGATKTLLNVSMGGRVASAAVESPATLPARRTADRARPPERPPRGVAGSRPRGAWLGFAQAHPFARARPAAAAGNPDAAAAEVRPSRLGSSCSPRYANTAGWFRGSRSRAARRSTRNGDEIITTETIPYEHKASPKARIVAGPHLPAREEAGPRSRASTAKRPGRHGHGHVSASASAYILLCIIHQIQIANPRDPKRP